MATYTVTTGNDVTQYTVSTGARGPAGPSGVGTTEEVLGLLQGTAADPTRIGAEYMPTSLTLDYIGVGEVPTAALPEGTIARVGTELRMHDGSTVGGIAVGSTIENAVPYHRASGTAIVIPYGETNSTCKIATTSFYWHELARVKVPGSEVIDGNIISLDVTLRMKSNAPIGALQRTALLVPSEFWDSADYFGTTPSDNKFQANTPTFFPFSYTASNSQESVSRLSRSHELVYGSGQLSGNIAASGTYLAGWNFTGSAAFVDTNTAGLLGTARADAADLKLVLVVRATATSTDYRFYDYTISASAAAP